jgi:hypothetical protein
MRQDFFEYTPQFKPRRSEMTRLRLLGLNLLLLLHHWRRSENCTALHLTMSIGRVADKAHVAGLLQTLSRYSLPCGVRFAMFD